MVLWLGSPGVIMWATMSVMGHEPGTETCCLSWRQKRIQWASAQSGLGIGESEAKDRLWHTWHCLAISGRILLRIGIQSAGFKAVSSGWEVDYSLVTMGFPRAKWQCSSVFGSLTRSRSKYFSFLSLGVPPSTTWNNYACKMMFILHSKILVSSWLRP